MSTWHLVGIWLVAVVIVAIFKMRLKSRYGITDCQFDIGWSLLLGGIGLGMVASHFLIQRGSQ